MSVSKSRKRKHPTDDDCKTSFLFKIEARRFVSKRSKSTPVVFTGVKIENVTSKKVQQSSKSSKHLNKLTKDPGLSLGIYGETIDKELVRKFAKLASDSGIDGCATVIVMVKSDIVQELKSLTLDDAEGEKCAICLQSLDVDGDTVNLPCLHNYHRTCLLGWLRQKQDCPLCRRPLPNDPRL